MPETTPAPFPTHAAVTGFMAPPHRLRRHWKWMAVLLFSCRLLAAAPPAETSAPATYANPLTITATVATLPPPGGTGLLQSRDYRADPEILQHGNRYYLYATGNDSAISFFAPNAALGVRCFSSSDLVHWKDEGMALDARNRSETSYTRNMIWSPHVIEARGEFWMFYNAAGEAYEKLRAKDLLCSSSPFQRLCVARSKSPTGPFVEHAAPLLDDAAIPGWVDGRNGVIGCIDAFVFRDDPPGRPPEYYLFWSGIDDQHNRNLLWGARLRSDFTGLLLPPEGPAPRIVIGEPMQEWETRACGERRIIEAPSMLKRGETCYLAYSANSFNTPEYAMGYATGPTPLGPFRRSETNPILKATATPADMVTWPLPEDKVIGPAGGSFVSSPDGNELFLVYGAIDTRTTASLCSNYNGYARRVSLDRARFAPDGRLVTDGPTRHKRLPLPSAGGGSD